MKTGTMKKPGRYNIAILLAALLFAGSLSVSGQTYENWQDIKASYLRIKLKGTIQLHTEDTLELNRILNIPIDSINPYCRGLYTKLVSNLKEFRSKDSDGDRLSDIAEKITFHTNPDDKDTDKDRLEDGDEVFKYHTDPADDDSDDDGLKDGDEVDFGSDPNKPDTDDDKLNDSLEFVWKTDPNNKDSDGDGLEDGDEVFKYKTRPDTSDSDGDNINDSLELFKYHTNPNNPDSDDDKLSDGREVYVTKTDPNDPDTDKDGLSDGDEEINNSDPNNPDSDGDGLTDGAEVLEYGTLPDSVDTDGDGYNDSLEVYTKGWGPEYAIDPDKPGEEERNELKPHFEWARKNGRIPEGESFFYDRALAIDTNSNCYFANRFAKRVDLFTYDAEKKIDSNSISYEVNSNYGIIAAKLGPENIPFWSHKIVSGKDIIPTGMAVDRFNNCYLAGYFTKRFVIDDSIKVKGKGLNSFLIKFDGQGKYLWHEILNKHGGKNNKVYCQDIQVDSSGNLYMAGGFRGIFELNDSISVKTKNNDKNDIFIAKLDSSRQPLWIASAGGSDNHDMANALAVDKDGNIAITGQVGSDVVMFSSAAPDSTIDTVSTKENEDIFIAKYNRNGKYLWNIIAGGRDIDNGKDVCFDNNGNIYIASNFRKTLYIGEIRGRSAMKSKDIVVVKFNPQGVLDWYRHFGGSGDVDVHSIAADGENNIYIAGDFTKTLIALGNHRGKRMSPIKSKGEKDGFILKLNEDGEIIWDPIRFGEKHNGSIDIEGGEGATCIVVDPTGNYIYVSGFFSGASKIGDIELESIRYSNFISRLNRGKLGK